MRTVSFTISKNAIFPSVRTLKPRMALAQTWPVPPQVESHIAPDSDAETHYAALILCEGGTAITLERGEYMPSREEDAWQIVGTKGTLHLKMTPRVPNRIEFDRVAPEGVVSETIWEDKVTEPKDLSPVLHGGTVEDFAAAILEGRRPKTGLEEALVVQKIADAIYASAESGRAVEIGG